MIPWLMALALAQDTPTALEVLSLAPTTTCPTVPDTHVPDILRTNVGIAQLSDSGSYVYGCPSRWGGDPDAELAITPDGDTWLIRSDTELWLTQDRGCTADRLTLPDGGKATAVTRWRDAFYVLIEAGGAGLSALYRVEDTGSFLLVAGWSDFVPDGMTPQGNEALWLSGAGPAPQVRRLSLLGGLSGNVALTNLPDDGPDIERIIPVTATPTEAWFRVERRLERWLWHVTWSGTVATFTTTETQWRVLSGPVQLDGRWWIQGDLSLHRADVGEVDFTITDGQPGWTCLHAVGDRVFACTIPALQAVIGIGPNGTVNAVDVFKMVEVGPPDPLCPTPACDDDWARDATAAGIFDAKEPAVCPDGTTLRELEGGCACDASTAGPRAAWLACGAWIAAASRRRRR